jgi:hypothetical protein
MIRVAKTKGAGAVGIAAAVLLLAGGVGLRARGQQGHMQTGAVMVHRATKFDVSPPLRSLRGSGATEDVPDCEDAGCGTSPGGAEADQEQKPEEVAPAPVIAAAGAALEQKTQGQRPGVPLLDSFDGLGSGFTGPQGTATFRNPSDNSLAVGPDHIVQIVNTRIAVYSKRGAHYDKTGTVIYGPVATNAIFTGFGGACEARDNGDAVVRYDQLAKRWLIVMPIFGRIAPGEFSEQGKPALPGALDNPGPALAPPPHPPQPPPHTPHQGPVKKEGTFAMCYAVSVGPDPLGAYYRYAFERTLFPDYPRPAIWPDGYYVPTSTGDDVIQKHDCIADRTKMLLGQPATEQCIIIDGVNFLNNADIEGQKLPPAGAPNIMMAAGGTQLNKIFEDDGIYVWKVHVDWTTAANTKAEGPVKIAVAPYHYLCNGQLTNCVPQPDTDRRLDVQGDKIMQRVVYRKIGNRESVVAAHSVATQAGGGGVRWYEFRLDKKRDVELYQQGTYAPDAFYRWIPSIAMDKKGDIGVGYSFGGVPNYAGQRFAARREGDPKRMLSFQETVLATGEAAQKNTLRWEDYTTTAIDPSDDCTFWYVGDYLKTGDENYRTKIGSFRVPGCKGGR